MKQLTATTTQRNQVTIPAEVRRTLGIKPRDKVAFTINDRGEVQISVAFTLETAYGSVKATSGDRNLDDIIREAKDEKSERTIRQLFES